MDKNERTKPPLKPIMAVSIAPVLTFLLANAMFLPLALALIDLSNSFLAPLLISVHNPLTSRLILIVVSMIFLPLSGAAVLAGPALTSFLVNLKHLILTDRPRAIWSGIVFFCFHTIFLVAFLIFRFISLNHSFYDPRTYMSSIFDPLACLLTLGGIVLSCSVGIAGRLGAKKGIVKHNRTAAV